MLNPRTEIGAPAFFLDTQRCTGCKTCMVACKDKNDLAPGVRWRRVVEYCGGQWLPLADGTFRHTVFAYYLSVSCNHCAEPICVEVCPTAAMQRGADGIVTVDPTRCMGCRYCAWACPYGAPQYDATTGRMTKCDGCRDELATGGTPACVAACPTRALRCGTFAGLVEQVGETASFAPLPDPGLTAPRAIFQPHRMGQPPGTRAGWIANPEENADA